MNKNILIKDSTNNINTKVGCYILFICMKGKILKKITLNLDLMEISGLDPKITICKIDVLPVKLYPR